MKLRDSVPALTLALALASQPVLAQGRHGGGAGGGRGGGSRGSSGGGAHGGYGGGSRGGYAVARHPSAGPRSGAVGGMHYGSRPGYAPRGSVAQQRHPRAGTGYGSGYYPGRGYNNGGHGYRPYYGYRPYSGYRPYYSSYPYYPYSPYYSSYWPGVSLSLGWGYGSSAPYYGGGYYGSPGYSVGVYAPSGAEGGDDSEAPPPPARAERPYEGRSGRVRLEVRPDDASVYVDDQFRGTAREARIMNLPPGRHVIELVRPGFPTERRELTVVSGESQDLLVELLRP